MEKYDASGDSMLNKILYPWIATNIACVLLNASTCNPYYPSAVAPSAGYTTFTFANATQNPGITAGDIYITMVGTTGTTGGPRNFVLFDPSGLGSLTGADRVLPTTYFYPLSALPTDTNGNPYAFVPNNLPSVVLYVGIDYGVTLQTATGTNGGWYINPATLVNSDANVYHLYDTISFSTSPKLQFLGTDLQSSYGLPLSVLVTYNSGKTTFYLGLPPTVPRDDTTTNSVFGSYVTSVSGIGITNLPSQTQWAHGVTSFIAAGNTGARTYLHLISPIQMLSNNTFDSSYLFNNTYGSNWFNEIWGTGPTAFYQPGVRDLYLDVSAIGASYTTYHYIGNVTGALTFVTDGAIGGTVALSPTTSQPFFNGNPVTFNATGDPAVIPFISQYLGEGFVTGIFPTVFPLTGPMNSEYIQNKYVENPTAFWGHSSGATAPTGGPWYNLYAAVLHNLAPFSSTNNFSNVNAETPDQPMGFTQNIPPLSASTTATVAIVVGNMQDSVVPNFTDHTLYYILIAPSPGVTAIYGTSTIGAAAATQFFNVTTPVDLIVEYGGTSTSYAGLTYATQVFFNGIAPTANYAFSYPQLPAPLVPALLNPTATGSTGWLIGIGRPN